MDNRKHWIMRYCTDLDMKNNIHKKLTFEDKFDRKFAKWVEDHPKAWRFWKKKARKDYRRMTKKEEREGE
jgi:hypothetical protein